MKVIKLSNVLRFANTNQAKLENDSINLRQRSRELSHFEKRLLANWKYFYLIRIEFLGFRFHGWQKQANQKSIHGMIDKTFDFVFTHSNYRTLGCARTDAKVSADDYAFELFTYEEQSTEELLEQLNNNLSTDIRVKSVQSVDATFNIIKDVASKEYDYHFSFGEKSHPYNAPFICDFGRELNIGRMQEAAQLFVGTHNFKRYVSKPSDKTIFEREIISSTIEKSTKYSGQFAPENIFAFKIKSKGFMRYQVRLMMGSLVEVGKGSWSLEDLKQTLSDFNGPQMKHLAPSSALVLRRVEFMGVDSDCELRVD